MVDIQEHEMDSETHLSEVKEWHSNRLMELRKPDGWLSVIGLHWLEPGARARDERGFLQYIIRAIFDSMMKDYPSVTRETLKQLITE